MSNKLQEFNEGHIVEGCDRCHTLMVMMDELLNGHPAVDKADGKALFSKAHKAIFDLYQKIGALDDE